MSTVCNFAIPLSHHAPLHYTYSQRNDLINSNLYMYIVGDSMWETDRLLIWYPLWHLVPGYHSHRNDGRGTTTSW